MSDKQLHTQAELEDEARALQAEALQALMDPNYDQEAFSARVAAFEKAAQDFQLNAAYQAKADAEARAKADGTWTGVSVTIQGFDGPQEYDLGVLRSQAEPMLTYPDEIVGGMANIIVHLVDLALELHERTSVKADG